MKRILFGVVVAALAGAFWVGCGKAAKTESLATPEGSLNAVQFYKDFESAPPEMKPVVDKVMMCIGDSDFAQMQKSLAQLDANPALTPAQKKSVADLTEQLKKKMAALAAAR